MNFVMKLFILFFLLIPSLTFAQDIVAEKAPEGSPVHIRCLYSSDINSVINRVYDSVIGGKHKQMLQATYAHGHSLVVLGVANSDGKSPSSATITIDGVAYTADRIFYSKEKKVLYLAAAIKGNLPKPKSYGCTLLP